MSYVKDSTGETAAHWVQSVRFRVYGSGLGIRYKVNGESNRKEHEK